MTGPEHYREAEARLALAEGVDWTDNPEHAARFATAALASAQVHATLALTAATAETTVTTFRGRDGDAAISRGWREATS